MMKVFFKRRFYIELLAALIMAVFYPTFVLAQDNEASSKSTPPSEPIALMRSWVVLGTPSSPDTYTLVYEGGSGMKDRRVLFSKVKGCYRSGYGAGYMGLPAGKVRIALYRHSTPASRVTELDGEFGVGEAYSLVAYLDNGKPKLKLIKESSLAPEEDGVFIYHFLEQPLEVQIGTGTRVAVPRFSGSPMKVSKTELGGHSLTFHYTNQDNLQTSDTIQFSGSGRMSILFMRDDYSRPATFSYSSEADNTQNE